MFRVSIIFGTQNLTWLKIIIGVIRDRVKRKKWNLNSTTEYSDTRYLTDILNLED